MTDAITPTPTIQINLERPGSTKTTGFKVAIRDAATVEQAEAMLASALEAAFRQAARVDAKLNAPT